MVIKRFDPLMGLEQYRPEAKEIDLHNLAMELTAYLQDKLSEPGSAPQEMAIEIPAFFMSSMIIFLKNRYPDLAAANTSFQNMQCRREAENRFTIIMPFGTDQEISTNRHLTFKFNYQPRASAPISDLGVYCAMGEELIYGECPEAAKTMDAFLRRRQLKQTR